MHKPKFFEQPFLRNSLLLQKSMKSFNLANFHLALLGQLLQIKEHEYKCTSDDCLGYVDYVISYRNHELFFFFFPAVQLYIQRDNFPVSGTLEIMTCQRLKPKKRDRGF